MRPAPMILVATGLILFLTGVALWCFAPLLESNISAMLKLGPQDGGVPATLWLTDLGGFAMLGPVAAAVALWLLWRGRRDLALWLFATVATGRLAVEGMKLLLVRPRPLLVDRLTDVSSYSFPSSHSAGTMLTWLALALLAPWAKAITLPLAIVLALVIGWTRVALGVHWPSDVLAGWGLGMFWVGLASRWLPQPAGR